MATIKKGYNDKPTHIRIDTGGGIARLLIEQHGLPVYISYVAGGGDNRATGLFKMYSDSHSETLAYTNINELIALRDELNEAIKELAGL